LNSSGCTDVIDPELPAPLPPSAWKSLHTQWARLRAIDVPALFGLDPQRFERLSHTHDGLLLDFSKQRIDPTALESLLGLARAAGLERGVEALFGARPLNFTENRAALHMALRGGCEAPPAERPGLHATEQRLRTFAERVRGGAHRGASGEPIGLVVNLGIGGSDLGPRMVVEALSPSSPGNGPDVRFVANPDPLELDSVLAEASPHTTLFIISSKSFGTAETLANAETARTWLRAGLGLNTGLGPHLAAVSNAVDAARSFGIPEEHIFPLPEWVGGRYSVWSAIGLPARIALGNPAFDALLDGGRSIDRHFREAPLERNLPVLLGLIGIWNASIADIGTLALLPYSHALRSLPAWLQQLEMESNGKHCRRDGTPTPVATAPVIWGGAGTVGQHAFHQLLYQGTRAVAVDFVVPVNGSDPRSRMLVDNALAQSSALMCGRTLAAATEELRVKRGLNAEETARLAPHLACAGNQPSTTLLLPQLTPYRLGQLMALYEHKVFVQGWLWGINSFDQYGVELGKDMARTLASGREDSADPSTAGLLAAAQAMRQQP